MNREKALILASLELMRADREWDRQNPDNPICPACHRHDKPDNISFDIPDMKVCAECADDYIQKVTGCRFGKSLCDHLGCK